MFSKQFESDKTKKAQLLKSMFSVSSVFVLWVMLVGIQRWVSDLAESAARLAFKLY